MVSFPPSEKLHSLEFFDWRKDRLFELKSITSELRKFVVSPQGLAPSAIPKGVRHIRAVLSVIGASHDRVVKWNQVVKQTLVAEELTHERDSLADLAERTTAAIEGFTRHLSQWAATNAADSSAAFTYTGNHDVISGFSNSLWILENGLLSKVVQHSKHDDPRDGAGYLYILMNASMPDVVKIGRTTRHPHDRVRELSAVTGVPTPFVLIHHVEVGDAAGAERRVHLALERFRVASNREFFRISVREAIRVLDDAADV